jgi:hypothetical protein
LLTNAVEHLFQLMFNEMKEKVGRLSNANDRRAAAIDLSWEIAGGPLSTAWIELVVASRTDSYLRGAVTGVNDRMAEFIDQSFKELFPRPEGAGDDYELIPQMVILILEAMALEGKTLNLKLTGRILNALKTGSF